MENYCGKIHYWDGVIVIDGWTDISLSHTKSYPPKVGSHHFLLGLFFLLLQFALPP